MTYAQLAGATLIWLTILGLPAAGVKSAIAEESARAWEETITIPTMSLPFRQKPDLLHGTVYQGAQGRVYPIRFRTLHDKKEDRRYVLMLENEYLSMSLLPRSWQTVQFHG